MNKKGLKGYIILTVALIILTVIAFAAPFDKAAFGFWAGYVFGVIAIAYQLYVFKIAFADGDDVRSRFYGFPIARVGIIYLIAQLGVSIIEMALAFCLPGWIAIIINVLLLGFAVVGCVAAEAMKEEIQRQDVQLKKDVSNMRELQSLSASLVGLCTDLNLKKTVEKMAEEFRYSDPVSSDQTKAFEEELKININELQKMIIDNEIGTAETMCKKISAGLKERNRLCAMSK